MMQPCENGCGRKAGYAKQYDSYVCSHCRKSLEGRVSRSAVAELRKAWKARASESAMG